MRCAPGGLILERSHEPYVFSHDQPADLWVVKVSAAALGGRIRQPDRFCSLRFDATRGGGGLFADMLELIPRRVKNQSEELRTTIGRQLGETVRCILARQAEAPQTGATA